MKPDPLALLLLCGTPVVVGVYFALVGYRVIGPKPGVDLKYDITWAKNGRIFRVLGLLLSVGGTLFLLILLARKHT